MKAYLAQIDGWSGSTPVTLRMASHDDDRLCHLDGQTWWPSIVTLPKRQYDFFDGAFGGAIVAPTGQIDVQVDALPNLPAMALHDARLRLWRGELGAAFSGYELLIDGRVQDQPTVSDGRASIAFGVDDRWLDQPLLAAYAGTGGMEGGADLKGQVKPLLLGAPRYAPGVLIDTVDNVWQLSAYGAIEAVEVTFTRLVRYGAPVGDAADLAALKAMAIGRGQWATCLAQGLVRFGAPPDGPVCFHVRGNNAGGWARRPGALIGRIGALAGASDRISSASLAALDSACPWNLSPRIDGQVTPRDLIQRIAASVNAVAVMGWTGTLYVHPVGIGSAALTLAADGSALPPVAEVRQLAQAAPFWRLAQQAEVTQTVHAPSDVAFTATPVDRGAYDSTALYREGDIVQLPDQSRWIFIAMTPAAGSLPADGNANWARMTDAIAIGGAYKLVNIANMTIAGDTVTKTGGGGGWNAKARTVQSFVGAVVSGRIPAEGFISLTTDPEASASYATDDYGLLKSGDGRLYRSRNGALVDIGGWSGNPLYAIEHDGRSVRYLADGAIINAYAPAAANEAVYGTFALSPSGASITDISFASAGLAGDDGTDGIDGTDGNGVEFVWKRAAMLPATPTGNGIPAGWSDDPPAGTDPLWMSKSKQELDGTLVTPWSTPIRHDGPPGANAIGVDLSASRNLINVDAAFSPTDSSDIVLTAIRQNTTDPVDWQLIDQAGTSHPVSHLTGTGDNRSLPVSNAIGIILWARTHGSPSVPSATSMTIRGSVQGGTKFDEVSISIAVDGTDGIDGEDGSIAEAFPAFFGVNCYSGGTPKPGQLASIAGQLRLRVGSTVITSGATYSVVSQSNMPGISIDGAGNFGGVTAILDVNASAVLNVNYGGVDYPVTIAARRMIDGSAANSGSAAITSFPASSTYAAAAGGVTLTVPNGAWLYADASCTYGPTSSGNYQAQLKMTYQNITDGGAETDFPTTSEHPATGGTANTSDPDGVTTSAAIQNTSGGTKSYTIRLYARRSGGGGAIPSGNLFGSLNGSVP
ncbi:MAG: hypothetical protein U5M50_03920 [Sphingobium sp.]|nr:hypothetical protein [Sphingobium sp.]